MEKIFKPVSIDTPLSKCYTSEHMKISFLVMTFLTVILTIPSFAQQPEQTIVLKDGTSIKGFLSSVANGTYTIESQTMGQVKIPAAHIASINAANVAPAMNNLTTQDGTLSPSAINIIKMNMLQDPQIIALLQKLAEDPSVTEILQNPALMQAALSMDPQQVQNNPDVQKLIQNPTMQEILRITAQKMQNTPAQ